MYYMPIDIANAFIAFFGTNEGISHMKLQKLVYITHGWWLAYMDKGSLLLERPQVWEFGPVFASLYDLLKQYGHAPITFRVSPSGNKSDSLEDSKSFAFNLQKTLDFCDLLLYGKMEEVRACIKWVWNRYGHLSALELSEMTSKDGTAWKEVAKSKNFRVLNGYILQDKYVREEFKKKMIIPPWLP